VLEGGEALRAILTAKPPGLGHERADQLGSAVGTSTGERQSEIVRSSEPKPIDVHRSQKGLTGKKPSGTRSTSLPDPL
jgi:hypothetical protein